MTRNYGEIRLKRHEDGTLTVEHADDVVGIATEILATLAAEHFKGGMLVADTAGEYVYKPCCFADKGRIVVCERVKTYAMVDCECQRWATDFRVGYPNGHHPRCEQQPDSDIRDRWYSGEYWRRDDAD